MNLQKKICEICGAIGFQEAIITCYQCKNVDVHQYCVLGYCEDAPEDWCCQKCDIDKGVVSSSRGRENDFSEGSKLHASANICQGTLPLKKRTKFHGGNGINWEKEVRTGKTRYIPVEESIGLYKKHGCQLKKPSSSRVVSTKSMVTVARWNCRKPRTRISNSFPEKSTVQQSLGSAGYTKPRNLQNSRITEHSNIPVQTSKGPGGSTILERRCPDAVNESQMMNPPMTHPCDPALVASWKGSFGILGAPEFARGMLNNCIQAHPPSRVRRKVYEFLGLLPDTLKFGRVPRGDIWPSLFNNHCPGKEDIGLYFLASGRERSEIYVALVKFMSMKDLVMRTRINDVELLVLASTVLCSDSQRLNSEHFLWGLFHRVRQDTVGYAEGGSNEVIDMEMDMIEGEDVCTANEVGMEGYQSEVEMEINMIAGENVGTLDFVASTTTRNGFDSSLTEPVTAATCNGSESVTPLVSRTSKDCKELPQVIKREPVDDFPPGFLPCQC